MDKTKLCSFYGELENEQKKNKKHFEPPERGFEPQIFINFHGKGWRDQIKTSSQKNLDLIFLFFWIALILWDVL